MIYCPSLKSLLYCTPIHRSTEGLTRFKDIKAEIRQARKGREQNILEMEKDTLAELRIAHGIECDSHENQLKHARAKKRKHKADSDADLGARHPKIVCTMDDEEDWE